MQKSCQFKLCGKKGECFIRVIKEGHGKIGKSGSLSIDVAHNPMITLTIFVDKSFDLFEIRRNILHEIFEGVLLLNGLRFENSNPNHYGQFFMFEHGDMSTMIDEVHKTFEEITYNLGVSCGA